MRTRQTIARNIVAKHVSMKQEMVEWHALAIAEGAITETATMKQVWRVFQQDAKLARSNEHYGSLYVTLLRVVNPRRDASESPARKGLNRKAFKASAEKWSAAELRAAIAILQGELASR